MGVVYEGMDPKLGRIVAIKTILKNQLLDAETADDYSVRFEREAMAVARLNHPNIVQVYDFGEEGDVAYIVMEFIKGRELKHFFDNNDTFDQKEMTRMMCELMDALDFAHQANIVHRDIKPANVMIDARGRVKLTDFGVARLTDAGASDKTQAGTMVGTPAYMAPEQITGAPIDHRADIFSAGVILYQFLTGSKPFPGPGQWTIHQQIVKEDPRMPSAVNASLSPNFDYIIRKALAKKRDDRYLHARDLAQDLRKVLAGESLDEDATRIALPGKDVMFSPGLSVSPNSTSTSPSQRSGSSNITPSKEFELEFWRSIKDSDDADDFDDYLAKFPAGDFADIARRKIARLRKGNLGNTTSGASSTGQSGASVEKLDFPLDTPEPAAPVIPAPAGREDTGSKRSLADARKAAEAEAKRQADEVRRKAQEAVGKAQAEARRKAEEDKRRHAEEAAHLAAEKQRAAEQQKVEADAAEARRQAEEQRKRVAAERLIAETERQAAEAARIKAEAEAEAKRKAEQQKIERQKAEAERLKKEQARKEADERARRQAEEARRQTEEQAQRKADEEARKKTEQAQLEAADLARKQAEAETRKKEVEAERLAAEARRAAEAEAQRKAEEARRKADAEARRRADEERQRAEVAAEARKAAKSQLDSGVDFLMEDAPAPVVAPAPGPAATPSFDPGATVALKRPDIGIAVPGTGSGLLDNLDARTPQKPFYDTEVKVPPRAEPKKGNGLLIGGGVGALIVAAAIGWFLTRPPVPPVTAPEPKEVPKKEDRTETQPPPKAPVTPPIAPVPLPPPTVPPAGAGDAAPSGKDLTKAENDKKDKAEKDKAEKAEKAEKDKKDKAEKGGAAEKAAADKAAADKAAADKSAADKSAADKSAADKAAADKAATDKAATDKAATDKAAADKAATDKAAADKAATDKAATDKAATDKARVSPADLLSQGQALEAQGKVKEAARLYGQAARGGNAQAAKRAGDIYNSGKGDQGRDYEEALKYYDIARKGGIEVQGSGKR